MAWKHAVVGIAAVALSGAAGCSGEPQELGESATHAAALPRISRERALELRVCRRPEAGGVTRCAWVIEVAFRNPALLETVLAELQASLPGKPIRDTVIGCTTVPGSRDRQLVYVPGALPDGAAGPGVGLQGGPATPTRCSPGADSVRAGRIDAALSQLDAVDRSDRAAGEAYLDSISGMCREAPGDIAAGKGIFDAILSAILKLLGGGSAPSNGDSSGTSGSGNASGNGNGNTTATGNGNTQNVTTVECQAGSNCKVESPSGDTKVKVAPNGPTIITHDDGRIIIVKPDGTVVLQSNGDGSAHYNGRFHGPSTRDPGEGGASKCESIAQQIAAFKQRCALSNWQEWECSEFARAVRGCPSMAVVNPDPQTGSDGCFEGALTEEEARRAECERRGGIARPAPNGSFLCAGARPALPRPQPGDICNDPRANPGPDGCFGNPAGGGQGPRPDPHGGG